MSATSSGWVAGARRRAAEVWGRRTWVTDHGPQVAIVVGLLLVVLGTAGFFGVFDAVQERDDLAELDTPVLEGLAQARSAPVTAVLTVITTVTGPEILPVLVLVGTLTWGFWRKQWWQAGLLAGAMIASTLVSVLIKSAVARPRPPVDTMVEAGVETTYSFPSGHTIGTATLLLVVGYLAWIREPRVASLVRWFLGVVLGVAVVALSRLYLGYHFVTDVVASVALAVAVLGGVVVVDRRRAARAARVTADA
ncbi:MULTISPECIES: phosphatase PAP2 family protein [unclassified Actinotalea]|uniref:phosphatase PAP2 family protein n=1 Tax=unclassified Actinotalea TaxID=2638618 RepID=UPI0015F555B9|nr:MULTISPECIES: phosphatase PAP2 family protein [unclassified Actinotalea]